MIDQHNKSNEHNLGEKGESFNLSHHLSLQKRARREDSSDLMTLATLHNEEKNSNLPSNAHTFSTTLHYSNPFNFTESLSKMNLASPLLSSLQNPVPLLEKNTTFRKSSEVISEKDRPSAFKRYESIKFNSKYSPNLLFKSP